MLSTHAHKFFRHFVVSGFLADFCMQNGRHAHIGGSCDMLLETARHPSRKCTGHERSRGWYLVSLQLVTPTSFYLFSGKLEYLNKIIRFNTSIVRMKMNPCEEIPRSQMPQTFQEEMKWFAKGFHQPKTRREISSATIDAFQAMIWDKPFDDLLPTYCC